MSFNELQNQSSTIDFIIAKPSPENVYTDVVLIINIEIILSLLVVRKFAVNQFPGSTNKLKK